MTISAIDPTAFLATVQAPTTTWHFTCHIRIPGKRWPIVSAGAWGLSLVSADKISGSTFDALKTASSVDSLNRVIIGGQPYILRENPDSVTTWCELQGVTLYPWDGNETNGYVRTNPDGSAHVVTCAPDGLGAWTWHVIGGPTGSSADSTAARTDGDAALLNHADYWELTP